MRDAFWRSGGNAVDSDPSCSSVDFVIPPQDELETIVRVQLTGVDVVGGLVVERRSELRLRGDGVMG